MSVFTNPAGAAPEHARAYIDAILGLLGDRNVAVAMGRWLAGFAAEPPEKGAAVLRDALEDLSELVREHAARALGDAEPGRE